MTRASRPFVSTALDQAKLASMLMRSPLVRAVVDQTEVDLPVAVSSNTFTPLVGANDVVGVKSGRTAEAGAVDVMAVAYRLNGDAPRLHRRARSTGRQRARHRGDAAYALGHLGRSQPGRRRVGQGAVLGRSASGGRRAIRSGARESRVLVDHTTTTP